MRKKTADRNRKIAYQLSNNFPRLLREFYRDYERRILQELANRGYPEIRPAHSQVFANLGMGSVRVSELAERAQITQQAMGKALKELERLGFIARDIDTSDKRARAIRLTERGIQLTRDSLEVVEEVRGYYDKKVGKDRLAKLEEDLRSTMGSLELEYLPESWVEGH